MFRNRVLLLSQLTCTLRKPKAILHVAKPAQWELLAPPFAEPLRDTRFIHCGKTLCIAAVKEVEQKDGMLIKILKAIGLDPRKTKLKVNGYYLYENVADKLNYTKFFMEFKMPDTFLSWFLITELHVWMLMVRTMADGKDGRVSRNFMVEAMWGDVVVRAKNLGRVNPSDTRSQITLLSHQFNAAIIGYDEGLLGDDKVLAGALWRRFFQMECSNPEHIEQLVLYVRKQMSSLDKLTFEVYSKPNVVWLELEECQIKP